MRRIRKKSGALTRIIAVLLFFAASAAVISYSLGAFEIPFVRRNPLPSYPAEISSIEESIKQIETGRPLIPDTGAGSSSSSPDSDAAGTTGNETEATDELSADRTGTNTGDATSGSRQEVPVYLTDFVNAGYHVTDADWNSGMRLAEIVIDESNLALRDTGSKKTVTYFAAASAGILFTEVAKKTATRNSVELYMGYIIVDVGKRDATSIFPKYLPSPDDPEKLVRAEDRDLVITKSALAIYSSYGILIGVYPASEVTPAYTRDTSNRPLFINNNKYYYIDELTGDFLESDYIDERDGRGLYFDYPARYGAEDSKLKKWAVLAPTTHSVFIDEYYVYARFAVNWRLAKPICEADARYADIIAKSSKPFAYALKIAKKQIAEESRAALTATTPEPVTTLEPEPTAGPPETGVPTDDATQTDVLTGDTVTDVSGTDAETSANTSETTLGETAAADTADAQTTETTPAETSATETSAPETGDTASGTEAASEPAGETSSDPAESASGETGADTAGWTSETETGSDTLPEESSEETTQEVTTPEPTEPVSTEEPHTLLNLTTVYYNWRFIFAAKQPEYNAGKTYSLSRSQSTYYSEKISWESGYRYAKAFNFCENYAVVVDDLGHISVINRNGNTAVTKNDYDTSTSSTVGYITRRYYTEPVLPDLSAMGSYYFDHGLIRLREISVPDYYEGFYAEDRDVLVDSRGKEYKIPSGYTMTAYSDGVIILESGGLYGCYSTVLERWIADPVFTSAEPFIEGLCVLGLSDGTRGVIDTEGRVVIAFGDGYTEITRASSGIIACLSDSGWHIFAKVSK
ncbi:MAG: hypothetical protein ILO42_00580 [Clostridia bacterium]|nr:hypothetical protein [Clostridia bacterium]